MSTLRESILNFGDIAKPVPVEVPEWDCTVYVREMNVGQRTKFEYLISVNRETAREALTVMSACEEDGTLMFTIGDIPALTEKNGSAVDRIVKESLLINKLTAEDVDDAEKK